MAIHAPAQSSRADAQPVNHHYLAWAAAVVGAGLLLIGAVVIGTTVAPPATPQAPAVEMPGAPVVNPHTGFTEAAPGAPVVNPHTGFTEAVPGAPVVNPHTGFTVEPASP